MDNKPTSAQGVAPGQRHKASNSPAKRTIALFMRKCKIGLSHAAFSLSTTMKKRPPRTIPRVRASKVLLLPMPRADAEAMALHCRLAFEAIRNLRASRADEICMAQTVLLTSFLTEKGHGLLDLETIRKLEADVLAELDRNGAGNGWNFPNALLQPLLDVVNEHDRQLREVRFGAIVDASERLNRLIGTLKKTN
jgi:hypothetical protein